MAATSTTTPVVAQTTMHNANPQDRPCLERFYQCSRCLAVISFFIIFVGAVNILFGVLSDQIQMYAGIVVLVIGIILLTLSIAWGYYAPRHQSNVPTMFPETAMTTTVVTPNAAYTPGLVRPPIIHGGAGGEGGEGGGGQQTFVYLYQPQQHAGSFQPVQIGSNQYQPAVPAVIQYPSAQPTLQPSASVERLSDQPPPAYNEVLNTTKATNEMANYLST